MRPWGGLLWSPGHTSCLPTPEQRWPSGQPGARPPASPAVPAPPLPQAPALRPAVCLAGLWEREAAVCFLNQHWGTQPAAGWAPPGGTGLRALPARASTAGGFPGRLARGWSPGALCSRSLVFSSQGTRVVSPRGRTRQEGLGNRAGLRGCCWAPGLCGGGCGGRAGSLALRQAAWPAPPGRGPTRAALGVPHTDPRMRVSAGLAPAVAPRMAGQAPVSLRAAMPSPG